MVESSAHIKRSPEMYLVGYAMARAGIGKRPPPWLGVSKWKDAYDLFFPTLNEGRDEVSFRNSLKNARDSFDGFFSNGRVGWRQSSKVERPPAPNLQVDLILERWRNRSDSELRDEVLGLLSNPLIPPVPQAGSEFDPNDETDARRRVLAEVARRQGQQKFRAKLVRAYDGACCVSGCDVLEVLEAAHIRPYTGPHRNVVNNGLLLRADLHTLFDLRLLRINPETMLVELSGDLLGSGYAEFHLKPLRLPSDPRHNPDRSALGAR